MCLHAYLLLLITFSPEVAVIGRRYNYPNGLTLNLPSQIPHNERGPCLIKTPSVSMNYLAEELIILRPT